MRVPARSWLWRWLLPATLAAPKKLMREKPIACLLRSTAKLGTLEIQTVLPKRSRGAPEVLVWGWPTPIWWNARTELSPERGKPVYGPAAREEARRLMREAKREKINFGWSTKTNLCRVAKGERPLSYSVWEGAQAYVRRVRRERKLEQDVRERPLQFRVVPGQGPMVGWRPGSPPRGMEPNAPKGVQDLSAERVRRTRKEVIARSPGRVTVPSDADAGSGALASRWTSVATPWSRPWPRQEAGSAD